MKTFELYNSMRTVDELLEDNFGTYENMRFEMDFDEDYSEEDMDDFLYREMNYQHDDLLVNMNVRTEGEIIVFADLGLWDGRRTGYKLGGHNIADQFYSDNDYSKWYIDRYDLKYTGVHHDGRNYYKYREIKPDLSEVQYENLMAKLDEGLSSQDMTRYTRSLRPYFKEVYGI